MKTFSSLWHCVKSVRIRSFSDPYFPAFGLNTGRSEYLSVFSPNAGKHKPEKLQIQTFFTQSEFLMILSSGYNSAFKKDIYENTPQQGNIYEYTSAGIIHGLSILHFHYHYVLTSAVLYPEIV